MKIDKARIVILQAIDAIERNVDIVKPKELTSMKIDIECPKCGNADVGKFSQVTQDTRYSLGAWECDQCGTLINIEFVTYDKDGEPENV